MIYFYQPRLQFCVYHYVQAHYLKAHWVLQVIRQCRSVRMRHLRLNRNCCFNSYVLNLAHHLLRVEPWLVLCDGLKHRCQWPLMSWVVVLIFVVHKIIWFLLYCVVGQVHEEIVEIALLGPNVLFSCKPRNPLLEDENSQRVDAI